MKPHPGLDAAKQLLATASATLARAAAKDGAISNDLLDVHQVAAYELAVSQAELTAAEEALAFAGGGAGRPPQEGDGSANARPSPDTDLEKKLAELFLAEALVAIRGRVASRAGELGVTPKLLATTLDAPEVGTFVERALSPANVGAIAAALEEKDPARGLSDEQTAYAETFRQFADSKVAPLAEKIHREDLLVPPAIVDGLKELGCFGLSIPQRYGGIQPDDRSDNMGMVVVTEELSRGSLAAAGSLITRPEILAKAILKGGTEEQKQKWLPKLATGEAMAAVAVTEPDFGSDVAGVKVTATRSADGWRINGVKTWCTFAGFANTLMVLARTDPDRAKKHRGLSVLIAEKPSFDGHEFACSQPGGGKMSGHAIPTIGYRGMHSFEVSFEDWLVPAENLIGGEKGLGQGFYLQMEGFSGGRLQTAARALGVMQAAFEAARRYSIDRKLFGKREIDFGLTRHKLARMAAHLHACRQATYAAARASDEWGEAPPRGGEGRSPSGRGGAAEAPWQSIASMTKLHACRTGEWVTREAMQIHGGMGYAEEFPVSRHFVDARVLSIFEGAEEVLALRVVARSLLEDALSKTKEVA